MRDDGSTLINPANSFSGKPLAVAQGGVERFYVNYDGETKADAASGFTGKLLSLGVSGSEKFFVNYTGFMSSAFYTGNDSQPACFNTTGGLYRGSDDHC